MKEKFVPLFRPKFGGGLPLGPPVSTALNFGSHDSDPTSEQAMYAELLSPFLIHLPSKR